MSESEQSFAAWYRDARHWVCIVLALACAGGAVYLRYLQRRAEDLEAQAGSQRAAIDRGQVELRELASDKKSFQDLLRRSVEQKEAVIREVADFGRELDVLTRRTGRLEQVRDDLKQLEGEFARYRAAEEQFKRHLGALKEVIGGEH